MRRFRKECQIPDRELIGDDWRISDIDDKNNTNVSANMLGITFSSRASLPFGVKRVRETSRRDCIGRGRRDQPKASAKAKFTRWQLQYSRRHRRWLDNPRHIRENSEVRNQEMPREPKFEKNSHHQQPIEYERDHG
jgi:hypothetical protein